MGEFKRYPINDFYRALERLEQEVLTFESDLADPRIKAMIRTKIQEARLLALELILPEEVADAE